MTGSGGKQQESWQVGAELRESIRGNKPDTVPAHGHTGLVGDDEIRRLLSHLQTMYDPALAAEQYDHLEPEDMPETIDKTDLYRMILRNSSTETLTRAIHNQDPLTQSAAIGDPGARSDISGMGAIDDLRDLVDEAAPIIYIYGPPGSGKTNFALLLAQIWQRQQTTDSMLLSNIRTWKESDEWIPTYGSLMEIVDEQTVEMEQGGITQAEDADPGLFVFDEASSHASGRGKKGAQAGKKLGPMVYKIRKASLGLIIIGHDGKDVHPSVRELATVIERSRGDLKSATVFDSVRNREGIDQLMDIDGIPETDYRYDDKEATSWEWTQRSDPDAPQESKVRRRAKERAKDKITEQTNLWLKRMIDIEGMDKQARTRFAADMYVHRDDPPTQRELADLIDVSQSSLGRYIREIRDQHEETRDKQNAEMLDEEAL